MTRDKIYTAIALRARPFGNAREGFFLTREEGIIRAAVYGGAKSKLRAHVSPYNSGILYIYHDPVRGSNKVTDFDCRFWHPGLREMYERLAAADEIARTILKGLGGDFAQALTAVEESLDALETADAAFVRPILVQFWWRWAGILGVRPELNAAADAKVTDTKKVTDTAPYGLFHNGGSDYLPHLGGGAAKWLEIAGRVPPSAISRFSIDKAAQEEAAAFCRAVLEQ